MSALPGSPEGVATTGLVDGPVEPAPIDLDPIPPQALTEAAEIVARYPVARSALLPMLHLVQSYQGYVSPEGVALCAEELGLTKAEVGAVATFYTMYKRRPTGRHLVSVCTNTLCSVLGGQKIMGTSMEALIHHFKLVTEGFRVPAGQVYVPIESPRGELGYHVVSDGSTRPWRVHVRDPGFVNLQATAAMSEGGMIADVIAAIASIDPVMGGVDR